jgi:hypothetical protein
MDDSLTPAVQIVAGLLVLFLGRRLFWLFVGVVGFYFGLQYGMKVFEGLAAWALMLLSIVLGVVCSLLTILLQRLAVILAGAMAGAILAIHVAPFVGLDRGVAGPWMAIVAGALLTAVLFSVLFDPMLILVSSLTGALMIIDVMPYDPTVKLCYFALLFIIGIAVQARLGAGERSSLSSPG